MRSAAGQYLAVLVGGTIGGGLRYSINVASQGLGAPAPLATLAVNLLGAFLLALLLGIWVVQARDPALWRSFLATGCLGAFTTWSTFMADTVTIADQRGAGAGLGFAMMAICAGVGAAGAGWTLASRVGGRGPATGRPTGRGRP
jgi:CrcB protein